MSDMTTATKVTLGSVAGLVLVSAMTVPASKHFEGYASRTYRDPVGIPTACWGETGPHIQYGMEFTLEQCIALHDESLAKTWRGLSCVRQPLAPHEAAALLSFAHNVGVAATCKSTMVRLIRSGAPAQTWCQQMPRWVYGTVAGTKVVLRGLEIRRGAEMHMCLHGSWGIEAIDKAMPVPQPDGQGAAGAVPGYMEMFALQCRVMKLISELTTIPVASLCPAEFSIPMPTTQTASHSITQSLMEIEA